MVFFFSLFLQLHLLQFVLAFSGFAFLQHDHTVFVGRILYILQYLPPCNIAIISLYVPMYIPIKRQYVFHILFRSNIRKAFVSSVAFAHASDL